MRNDGLFMTTHSLFKRWTTWVALLLIPLLPACFVSNWPLPAHQAALERGTVPSISLYIPAYLKDNRANSPYLYQPSPGFVVSRLIARIPAQEEVLGFRLVSQPSDRGTFCTLHLSLIEPSAASQLGSLLSLLTYFVIPTYNSSMTFAVTYDVFSDTHFIRQYRYQVQGKRLIWLLTPFALPFLPGQWNASIQPQTEIPDGLMQGLLSTLPQLKADGQRDGLFN